MNHKVHYITCTVTSSVIQT